MRLEKIILVTLLDKNVSLLSILRLLNDGSNVVLFVHLCCSFLLSSSSCEQHQVKDSANRELESVLPAPTFQPEMPFDQTRRQPNPTKQYPAHHIQQSLQSISSDKFPNQGANELQYPQYQPQMPTSQWPYYYPPPPHIMYGGTPMMYMGPPAVVYEPLDPTQSHIPPFIPGGVGQSLNAVEVSRVSNLSRISFDQQYASGNNLHACVSIKVQLSCLLINHALEALKSRLPR